VTVALTLAMLVLLLAALSRVGAYLINAERARIISQVGALAAVYGGEPSTREVVQLNRAKVCDFRNPANDTAFFTVCVDVQGTQRSARAVDSWTISVPTLAP
jgi:hypothetical protein